MLLSAEDFGIEVDPNIKNYQKVDGISGNLSSVGSDTLANLMTLWAESFRKFYPSVNVQNTGCWFFNCTSSSNRRYIKFWSNESKDEI